MRPRRPRAGFHVRGFTLIELLVVVSLIVMLIALLMPALGRARESARRAACLSNQHQVANAAVSYPQDHAGLFIPCASRRIQLNVAAANAYGPSSSSGWTQQESETNWVDEWASVGALDFDDDPTVKSGDAVSNEIWNCPSRLYKSQWQVTGSVRVVTTSYQYLGGVKVWTNPYGSYPSRSPVRTSSTGPGWVLIADGTMKIDGAWGQGHSTSSPYAYVDMPSHKEPGEVWPAGGNQVYADGSGAWIPFEQTIYIHSWSTNGSREAYWYQKDLGTYNPPAIAYGAP